MQQSPSCIRFLIYYQNKKSNKHTLLEKKFGAHFSLHWRDAYAKNTVSYPRSKVGNRTPSRGRMEPHPDHFPRTAFKIAYTQDAVHLIFLVADRYVRAMATGHQQNVCADSCVEFFFSPGPDTAIGYFNLEINCGGTVLFHFHPKGTIEEFDGFSAGNAGDFLLLPS